MNELIISEVETLRSSLVCSQSNYEWNKEKVLEDYFYCLRSKKSLPSISNIVDTITSDNTDIIHSISVLLLSDVCNSCSGYEFYSGTSDCTECYKYKLSDLMSNEEDNANYLDVADVVFNVLLEERHAFIASDRDIFEYEDVLGIDEASKTYSKSLVIFNNCNKVLIPSLLEDNLAGIGNSLIKYEGSISDEKRIK